MINFTSALQALSKDESVYIPVEFENDWEKEISRLGISVNKGNLLIDFQTKRKHRLYYI